MDKFFVLEVLWKLQPMVKVMKGFLGVTKQVAKMAQTAKKRELKEDNSVRIRQAIKQLVKLKLALPLRNRPKMERTKSKKNLYGTIIFYPKYRCGLLEALRSLSRKIEELKNKLWVMKQSLIDDGGKLQSAKSPSKLLGRNVNPMESQQQTLDSLR